MKYIIPILITISLFFFACTKQIDTIKPYKVSSDAAWVKELQQKNPFKDSTNITSVYFRYDTIVNGYEVSGVFYPIYQEVYKNDSWGGWSYESGVYMIFRNVETGNEFIFDKMGKWISGDDDCGYFISSNILDIFSNSFKGFGKEDAYIFNYNDEQVCQDNPLLLDADFQFADVDFDGIDELVICTHGGGPRGSNSYDAYELTTNGLVLKEPYNKPACWFAFNEDTRFDTINKCVICSLPESSCQWGEYVYQADENGDLRYIRHISYFSDPENDTLTADTTEYN